MRNPLVSRPAGYRSAHPHAASDRLHVERLLAAARVAMCVGCLVPVWTGALSHLPYGGMVSTLLLAYSALSVFVLAILHSTVPPQRPIGGALHAADFAWAMALTLVTGGAASPLFVLFLFAVLSAAFRWRLYETLLTGVAAVAAMAAHTFAFGELLQPAVSVPGPFAPDLLVIRATYVMVAATLVGVLAENEKGRSEQLRLTSELLAGVQSRSGFRVALRYLSAALMRLTGSDMVLIAARELDTERAVLWTATRARSGTTLLATIKLPQDRLRMYFFHGAGEGWSIVRRRRDACTVTAIDRDGDVVPGAECDLQERFWQFHQHHAALVVSVGFGGAWRGRVYLLRERAYSLDELRLVHRALFQLVPAMHNHYLVRRLRSRAVAAERRRVARDLHDGVVRSLAGLETQTAALRRQVGARDPDVGRQLQRIERALADETKAVRDVMRQIRPFDAGPGQLVPALAEMVKRFGRDSRTAARFYAGPEDVYVSPWAARQLARTLQEALTNIRRHSGARRVEVEFRADADAWRLDLVHDGRPFGFLGRLDLDELEARRLGPRVIKERVREMGGNLVIESSNTAGVRLEISLARTEGQSKSA